MDRRLRHKWIKYIESFGYYRYCDEYYPVKVSINNQSIKLFYMEELNYGKAKDQYIQTIR